MPQRMALYRLAAPNENCTGCGFALPEPETGDLMAWLLLAPGVDPAFFMAQNGGLCAECVLNLLGENDNAWELRSFV